MKIRCYSELSRLETFKERYDYLRIGGQVGESTFGFDRYLNQKFYKSFEWKAVRREVILRDNGCDLGIEDRSITGRIIIHHMNPITINDVVNGNPDIFNPEFLICASQNTHEAIHYGNDSILFQLPKERKKWDTVPWK